MTRLPLIVGIAGVLSTLGMAADARAQPNKPTTSTPPRDAQITLSDFVGDYRVAVGRREVERRIEAAVDRAVDGLFFAIRGIARGRLHSKNPPITRISIDTDAETIAVTLTSGRGRITYRSPQDGSFVVTRDPDGEKIRLSQRSSGTRLVQIFVSSEGRRVNAIRMRSDGDLRMHVSVRSEKLSAPAEYVIPFRRVQR